MTVEAITKKALKLLQDQAPTILTVIASAGVIGTAYLAVKATPKVIATIEGEEEARNEPLKPVEKIQLTWAYYAPAMLVGAATLTCIIGSNVVSVKRQTALMGALTLSETAYKRFREASQAELTPAKQTKVIDESAKASLEAAPSVKETIIMGTGEVACFDAYSGRHFKSSADAIRKAENKFNKMLNDDRCASLNELYVLMGLRPTEGGQLVGWNSDNHVDIAFTSELEDDIPVMVISFRVPPTSKYLSLW